LHFQTTNNAIIERISSPTPLNNMKSIDHSSRRKFIKAGGIVIASSIIATAGHVFAKEEKKEE